MNQTQHPPIRHVLSVLLLLLIASGASYAQPGTAAGQAVLTSVHRLLLNPPQQVIVLGYFPTINGLPGPLFSGAPGENTAYFTWTLNAAGAQVLANGDISVAVLKPGNTLNIYLNANPNQNWDDPASFSAGQLVASFESGEGTQTGRDPASLVTQTYVLTSSQHFFFKGKSFSFAQLIGNGFTMIAFGSNIPLPNALPGPPALVFTGSGTGVAVGPSISGLPNH